MPGRVMEVQQKQDMDEAAPASHGGWGWDPRGGLSL